MSLLRAALSYESTRFLLLLIGADALFVALHLLDFQAGFSLGRNYTIWLERGYAEVFTNVKEFWIVVMFLMLLIKRVEPYKLAWGLLFLYVFVDDMLSIHNRVGGAIVNRLGLEPLLGLRAQDFGELSVYLIVGIAFLFILAIAYVKSGKEARLISRRLALLVGALAFFAVLIDMAGIIVGGNLLALVEEAGEMIVVSLIAVFVWRLTGRELSGPPVNDMTIQEDRRGYPDFQDPAHGYRPLDTITRASESGERLTSK